MFKPIFRNAKHQAQFESDGYIKLKLLDDNTCDKLNAFYFLKQEEHKLPAKIRSTADTENYELKKQVQNNIMEVVHKQLDVYLKDYNVLTATYLIKDIGLNSDCTPHQDWSLVDETQFTSMSVWCPLIDVDFNNGALMVLPGSHKFNSTKRVLPSLQFPFETVNKRIVKRMKVLKMSKGDAIFYHHGLIHASGVNNSETVRTAFVVGVYNGPDKIELNYHNKPTDDFIEVFELSSEDFLRLKKHEKPPSNTFVRKEPYKNEMVSPMSFELKYWGNELKKMFKRYE